MIGAYLAHAFRTTASLHAVLHGRYLLEDVSRWLHDNIWKDNKSLTSGCSLPTVSGLTKSPESVAGDIR